MTVAGEHVSKSFVPGLVLFGVTLYGLGLLIYRLFLSPLCKIPGPWLTRISTVPEANALKENRRAQWITDLFKQNPGAIAIRTSPNSVSFNHPDAVKEIYGMAEVSHLCHIKLRSHLQVMAKLQMDLASLLGTMHSLPRANLFSRPVRKSAML